MADGFWEIITHKRIAGAFFGTTVIGESLRGLWRAFPTRARRLPGRHFLASLGAAAGIAAALVPVDQALIDPVREIRQPAALFLIDVGAVCGRIGITWAALAVIYWGALAARRDLLRQWAFGSALSSALTGLLAWGLKHAVARARPLTGLGPMSFFHHSELFKSGDFMSFPGGDVAACAGITGYLVFALRTRLRFALPLLAVLTAMSRMHLNKHWPSDCAFSFVAALGIGRIVSDYLGSGPAPRPGS